MISIHDVSSAGGVSIDMARDVFYQNRSGDEVAVIWDQRSYFDGVI